MARLLATGLLLLSLLGNPLVVVTGASTVPALRKQPPRPHTGPTVPPPNVQLCDQEELITVARKLTNLRAKKLCQAAIDEKEMMEARDPLVVCHIPTCIDALQTMYATLPRCRFRDWNVQFHAERLLRNCAIIPQNADTPVPDVMPAYDGDLEDLGCSPQLTTTAQTTDDAATPAAARDDDEVENSLTQHDLADERSTN